MSHILPFLLKTCSSCDFNIALGLSTSSVAFRFHCAALFKKLERLLVNILKVVVCVTAACRQNSDMFSLLHMRNCYRGVRLYAVQQGALRGISLTLSDWQHLSL